LNNRHVAALALLGWYLLAPPLRDSAYDVQAPFSKWFHIGEFDTVAVCHAERDRRRVQYAAESRAAADPNPRGAAWTEAHRCVATNDPRLAKYAVAPARHRKAGRASSVNLRLLWLYVLPVTI
jgi:hypothetical protein